MTLASLGQFASDMMGMFNLTEIQLRRIQVILALVALISSAGVIRYIVKWYDFRRRVFFNQMVIGVNIVDPCEGGISLKLRTLIEDELTAILDNAILVLLVQKAAKACTEENPILQLHDPEDHALLLTKLQNAISHLFAREYVLLALRSGNFAFRMLHFAVTCEQYGGIKATKIRVLVYRQDEIAFLADQDPDSIKVEVPHHSDRVRTLAHIARRHRDSDGVFGAVEVPIQETLETC